jgi:hypothetical protein
MIFPIQFGIPESKIIDHIPEKKMEFAPLIPGQANTYIYTTEESYYKMYQDSIFGITHKKGGWDCLRHYEILANGCIPFFTDLEQCPKQTMVLFPKEFIRDVMTNYKMSDFSYTSCIEYLLNYTRTHLTTRAIAKYMLEKSGHLNATSVLYLADAPQCDYLRTTVIHGFKLLFGKNCHDYTCYNSIYTDYPESSLHPQTKGISVTRLLDKTEMRDASRDATIREDIQNKRYDIVIFEVHMGMPLLDLVKQYYPPSHILYVCGVDIQPNKGCSDLELSKDSPFFWREIPDL